MNWQMRSLPPPPLLHKLFSPNPHHRPQNAVRYRAPLTHEKPQPNPVNDPRFLAYLQQNLGLSEAALAIATRQRQPTNTELPIVLWNYGLITLEQVGQIFDWMAEAVV